MMFGTLEARKQDEHNIFEEKPPFYDTPAEQLSDDQIKQCREYDRKEKLVRDAEETQVCVCVRECVYLYVHLRVSECVYAACMHV